MEELIAREGSWGAPRPLKDSSSDGAHHGNHESQLHHKGWSDGGDLYGHCDYFCGESGPQWPWIGDLNLGAHHRGHHRPCMMNWPMTTFGQKGRMMTTFRKKDWDAIGWKPPSNLIIPTSVMCHSSYLCLLIGRVHVLHLHVVFLNSRYLIFHLI